MTRLVLVGLALLGGGSPRAGEELMPMRGNAYSEVSSSKAVGALRKTTSLDVSTDHRGPAAPQTHKNMVRVTLPSLGVKSESPPRLIEMDGDNLDGSLNFSLVRPAPSVSESGIPGLVMPEILALDKYRLAEPEPPSPAIAFPELEVPYVDVLDAAIREQALAGIEPLREMPHRSRTPDFPPLPAARPIARATMQPSPTWAGDSHSPLRIDLSASSTPAAQLPDEADHSLFLSGETEADVSTAVFSLRPPSSVRPPPEKQGRRQPQAIEPPAVRVPGLALDEISVPGAGAMLPYETPYCPMPEPTARPLPDEDGASVETLRKVLSPIYDAGKRLGR